MLKVVIADDENKICQLLQVIVDWNALGFEIVAVAHNGLEALEHVRNYAPDVVLTDIQMPECSGLELLHRIREEKHDIDILIISGYREFEYARRALQDGVEDYLLKPIKRAELEASLKSIAARRQQRSTAREEIQTIQKTLEQSVDKLHRSLIHEIADGRIAHLSCEKLNTEYRCGFSGQELQFASIKVYMTESIQEKTEEVIGRKLFSTVQSGLRNAGVTACCENLSAFEILALIELRPGQDLEQIFYRLIYAIKDFMGRMTPAQVAIGLERVRNDALHEAAVRCRLAAQDQILCGTERIIRYEEPEYELESALFVNDRTAQEIRRGLTTLDAVGVSALADQIMAQMRTGLRPVQSGANVRRVMEALLQQIASSGRTLDPSGETNTFFEEYEHRLDLCGRWDDYRNFFGELAVNLIRMLDQQRLQRENKPIAQAKRLIQENFREALSLEQISSELGLSPTYFSSMFKKETGVTVTQYITNVRMEEAKRLLVKTNEPIGQIAEQVGYRDEKYFSRIFKSTVGLKAGEYRRIYG